MTKICSKCKKEKDVGAFYRSTTTKSGLRARCKECMKVDNASVPFRSKDRQAEYREANRERLRENNRAYEKRKREEHGRGWRTEYQRQYYKENKRVVNDKRNRWLNETGKGVEYANRRRALKESACGNFTADEFKRLSEYFGGFCLRCGDITQLTPDHIVPLSLGGSNSIDNIQPLCRSCNCSKGASIADYRM